MAFVIMACYRPVVAWKPLDGGAISFSEMKDCREIRIKCGQCIGCRLERREFWTIRCYLESKMHRDNCFVTLTYDEAHYPQYGSLCYRDFQLFAKRLRAKVGPFRFFMCGEYGDELDRPHYHALFFGLDFSDKYKCNSIRSSFAVYRSETLESCWTHGFSSIGDVSYASARYCAAYTTKKVTGDLADSYYSRVVSDTGEIVRLEPEFAHMSLRPGIGLPWLERYWKDLYTKGHNAVIVNGEKKRIPRYFDRKMDEIVPLLMDEVEFERYNESLKYSGDNTPDRLAVREQVELARVAFNKDRLESKKCVTKLLP